MPSSSGATPGRGSLLVALILACASAVAPCQEQESVASQDPEPKQRAAMLRASIILKIAPYLTLETPPPEPPATYTIAVIGKDAVGDAMLVQLPGKKVGAAVVKVVEISPEEAAAGKAATACDLVYIAASVDADLVKRITDAHARRPVPTVCERPGFAANGGAVQIFVQDNGVKFEVNAEVLKKQGVRASPQLLKLSKKGPQ